MPMPVSATAMVIQSRPFSCPFAKFVAALIIDLAVMLIGRVKGWSNKRTLVQKNEDGNVVLAQTSRGRREASGRVSHDAKA
jgi:hypothetical protein